MSQSWLPTTTSYTTQRTSPLFSLSSSIFERNRQPRTWRWWRLFHLFIPRIGTQPNFEDSIDLNCFLLLHRWIVAVSRFPAFSLVQRWLVRVLSSGRGEMWARVCFIAPVMAESGRNSKVSLSDCGGVPSGLNRIRTRRASSRDSLSFKPDELIESRTWGVSKPPLNQKQKLKNEARGSGKIRGSSKKGLVYRVSSRFSILNASIKFQSLTTR